MGDWEVLGLNMCYGGCFVEFGFIILKVLVLRSCPKIENQES